MVPVDCNSCVYFFGPVTEVRDPEEVHNIYDPRPPGTHKGKPGECHRFPPSKSTTVQGGGGGFQGPVGAITSILGIGFVQVQSDMVCGEWASRYDRSLDEDSLLPTAERLRRWRKRLGHFKVLEFGDQWPWEDGVGHEPDPYQPTMKPIDDD